MYLTKFAPIALVLILASVVVSFLFFSKKIEPNNNQNGCTLEAKICPDGTSVGREGPNCEFAACSSTTSSPEPDIDKTPAPISENPKEACEESGGVWSEQYRECEGLEKEECTKIEGEFDECASPCRHDPDARVCITMCVEICKFN